MDDYLSKPIELGQLGATGGQVARREAARRRHAKRRQPTLRDSRIDASVRSGHFGTRRLSAGAASQISAYVVVACAASFPSGV